MIHMACKWHGTVCFVIVPNPPHTKSGALFSCHIWSESTRRPCHCRGTKATRTHFVNTPDATANPKRWTELVCHSTHVITVEMTLLHSNCSVIKWILDSRQCGQDPLIWCYQTRMFKLQEENQPRSTMHFQKCPLASSVTLALDVWSQPACNHLCGLRCCSGTNMA